MDLKDMTRADLEELVLKQENEIQTIYAEMEQMRVSATNVLQDKDDIINDLKEMDR